MKIEDSIALVTGANRGVGARFVTSLLERGARKVYAAARDWVALAPGDSRIVPIVLDITDPEQVTQAVAIAGDVTLLINNAGINRIERAIQPRESSAARAEMEVNYFGTLSMCRAFTPVLMRNGGAVVNMLSILSRVALPAMGSLCASKAAALRMTECLRAELAAHDVRVLAILPGAIDTDMSRDFPPPKLSLDEVVDAVYMALADGPDEVVVGAMAQDIGAGLAANRLAVQTRLAGYL
jgi:NAD(P)-dependent dehydrogenase (short-subunit alcohol dehydrogenase family)